MRPPAFVWEVTEVVAATTTQVSDGRWPSRITGLPNETRLTLIPSGPAYAAIENALEDAGADRLLAAVAEVGSNRSVRLNERV
jgi:hypothetical protein